MADQFARERTRSIIQAAQLSPTYRKPRPGKKVPRPGSTGPLVREYGKAIASLVSRAVIREAFAELMAALPGLIESARRERGDVAIVAGAVAMSIANITDPVQRVHAWLTHRNPGARIDADEGKRARALVAIAKARMHSSVGTTKIEALAEEFGKRTATFQRIQLSRQTKATLGADVFYGDRGLRNRLTNFASENVSLIKGITDDVATRVEKSVTRALTSATPHPRLAKQLEEEFGYGERRAKLIARDQIGKLYGQIDASRQKELGVSRFIWRASDDERTREHHAEWEKESDPAQGGTPFSYDDPPIDPDTGDPTLPGEAILCRCTAEPVLDDLLEV